MTKVELSAKPEFTPKQVSGFLGIDPSHLPNTTAVLLGRCARPSRGRGVANGYSELDVFLLLVAKRISRLIQSIPFQVMVVSYLRDHCVDISSYSKPLLFITDGDEIILGDEYMLPVLSFTFVLNVYYLANLTKNIHTQPGEVES